jgi:hypothetical protein
MKTGLEIKILWIDDHALGLLISGSNGTFAGSAEMYAPRDILTKITAAIQGFPSSPGDERTFEIGTFAGAYDGGGARLHLFCEDSLGHAAIEVTIKTDSYDRSRPESAQFTIPVVAAVIDDFVARLGKIPLEAGAAVELYLSN